jgi:hypothetical protein
MKKMFLSLLLAGATSAAFAQTPAGQGELTTTTTTIARPAPTAPPGIERKRSPQAVPLVPSEGAVQVAVRTRQPLQMVNPLAPARYGSGQERAMHDQKDPGKPKGSVLWSFVF